MFYLTNYVFSAFSFVAFILALIPLPRQLQAWNAGTCLLIIWTALQSLNYFVNSIVWSGNVSNPVPVWCDISSRIVFGGSIAISSATLCINRRLYCIASIRTVAVSGRDKRQAIMLDLTIGLGIPFLVIALYYIVQDYRFYIIEDFGCFPANAKVPLTIFLAPGMHMMIAFASASYGVLTIRLFPKRRPHLEEAVSSISGLPSHRYLRLICLASIDLFFTIPVYCAFLIYEIQDGFVPWYSWAYLHSNISQVEPMPAVTWTAEPGLRTALELSRWSIVVSAFLIFGILGLTGEARKNYKASYLNVAKRLGYARSCSNSTTSIHRGPAPLPVFVREVRIQRWNSFNSEFSYRPGRLIGEEGEKSGSNQNPAISLKSSSAPPFSNCSFSNAQPFAESLSQISARPKTSKTM